MTNPVEQKAGESGELERLSKEAVTGEMIAMPYKDGDGGCWLEVDGMQIAAGLPDEDGAFIAALWNAYRSGLLSPSVAVPVGGEGTGAVLTDTGSRPPGHAPSDHEALPVDPSRGDINPEVELGEPRPVTIDYVNWRGERGRRRILPTGRLVYGATEWHPRLQWLLEAMDLDKSAVRLFAFEDMQMLSPAQGTEAEGRNTEGGSVHEGPVDEVNAPDPNPITKAQAVLDAEHLLAGIRDPERLAATFRLQGRLVDAAAIEAALSTLRSHQESTGEGR